MVARELSPYLFRTWIHSHEEDGQGVQVYRPSTYVFPPSRGRRGFEIRPGGDIVLYGIAAGEGTSEVKGSWTLDPDGRLLITVPVGRARPDRLEILSVDAEALKVRI